MSSEKSRGPARHHARPGVAGALVLLPALALADAAQFNIPAQPLPAALKEFAAQSHMQLMYQSSAIARMTGNAVSGDLEKHAALELLLQGTGLEVVYSSDTAASIRPKEVAAKPDPVTGDGVHKAGQGNVTPAPDTGSRLPAQDPEPLGEIVVTATRQAQAESKVPISITAVSEEDLDARGAKRIDDIARIAPGVNFSRDAFGGTGNRSQISIRGIESTVGASTTGIYIDDTPIQTRNAGYTSTSVFPEVFDLSRVEILRGPQGTLFGSGSEGGTVRFITPEPGLNRYSAYSRSEVVLTEGGDPGYEVGAAFGGPIVPQQLGFRASAFFRQQGGWIDRVDRLTGATVDTRQNSQRTVVLRLAGAWVVSDALKITPSVFYQDIQSQGGDTFWESLSNPAQGRFLTGNTLPSPSRDKFSLPALKIEYDFGSAQLVSNTSYLDRNSLANPDYTQFVRSVTTGQPYPLIPGEYSRGDFIDKQQGFTEEVRVQSQDPDARLNWVTGVFFNRTRQLDTEIVESPYFPQMVLDTFGVDYLQIFGTPLGAGNSVFTDMEHTIDKQTALFGQFDYRITSKLKATAGLRYAFVDFSFTSENEGPFAGHGVNSGRESEHPATPKFGLSYQADEANLIYASAAKGFRPGGAQRVPPVSCAGDLAALGMSSAPSTYSSDSVWSYEVGAKDKLLQGKLQLGTSVFWINWRDIQQIVSLPDCGQSFVANLGKAISKGFDVSLDTLILDGLTLHAAAGYTSATFSQSIYSGPALIAASGDATSTLSPWVATVSAQYNWRLAGHDSFIRVDDDFTSKGPRPDVRVYGTDPALFQRPATNLVAARTGMDFGGLNAAIFVDNLFDSHTILARIRDIPTSPLFTETTFRPRSVGLTLTYRY